MAAPIYRVQVVALNQAPEVKVKIVALNQAPEIVVKQVANGEKCDLRVAVGNPAELKIALAA